MMKVVVRRARSNEPTVFGEFAEKYGLVLNLVERPDWVQLELGKDQWEAYFEDVSVMKGGYPDFVKGWGATQEDAVSHYAAIIADKQIIIPTAGLFGGKDKEIRCPDKWSDTSFAGTITEI